MVETATPVCQFGAPAPDFASPDPSGRVWTLDECRGQKGTIVMFICNHCPFVKAILDRLVRDMRDLEGYGVSSVAIMSNDSSRYPEDSRENMALIAQKHGFCFPYLVDADQRIAKAYGAVCTPDFFAYNADLGLQYRGRLDASGIRSAPADAHRDLFEAMLQVARTGSGPTEQVPSIGCSIKWL